jgi:hypothetical protein
MTAAGSSIAMSSSQGLGPLLIGHAGYGLGMGFAMHAAPAYIAETAPSSVRQCLLGLQIEGI